MGRLWTRLKKASPICVVVGIPPIPPRPRGSCSTHQGALQSLISRVVPDHGAIVQARLLPSRAIAYRNGGWRFRHNLGYFFVQRRTISLWPAAIVSIGSLAVGSARGQRAMARGGCPSRDRFCLHVQGETLLLSKYLELGLPFLLNSLDAKTDQRRGSCDLGGCRDPTYPHIYEPRVFRDTMVSACSNLPTNGIRSSISSNGASKAGTAIRQNALAATSRANCSAADSAASFAASPTFDSRLDFVGGALKSEQQKDCKPPLQVSSFDPLWLLVSVISSVSPNSRLFVSHIYSIPIVSGDRDYLQHIQRCMTCLVRGILAICICLS
jgi:hypothetical protein